MFLVLIPFTMFLPFDRKRYFEADTLPHSKVRKKKKTKKNQWIILPADLFQWPVWKLRLFATLVMRETLYVLMNT